MRERRAEQLAGVLHGAAADQAADVAGGDDLAVDLQQRRDAGLEARVGAQQSASPCGLVAEAEVLADRDVRRLQRADEDVVDELLRRCARRTRGRTG